VKTDKVFYCNVDLSIDIIGGKWKPLIIHYIGKHKVLRFGQMKKLIPNVNERVLSRMLGELTENQIIQRKDYNENPPRVEYSLTDIGCSVLPIINELGEWGKQYNINFDYGKIQFEE